MLSICTSIYKETNSFEIFVRSVFGNASDPSEIEIVVANDEGSPEITKLMETLKLEYPNLKHFTRTKRDRIKFLKDTVKFYRDNKIFNEDELSDMDSRIADYQNGKLDSIWFPAGKLFNQAASMASGDVLLFVPADYLCFGDLSQIYKLYKDLPGDVVGYFEWIDTTSLDPMPDVLETLKKTKTHSQFREITGEWLQQAFSNEVTIVPNQHGMRMMRKDIFENAGKFDGRWFMRSWNEDSLNQRMQNFAGTHRLYEINPIKALNPFFGTMRGKAWKFPNYLCSKYDGIPEIHNLFLERVKFYLEGRNEKTN